MDINGKYDDIINLPHPTSTKHPRMTVLNRAAQFSPFAALTGYDSAIKEKARVTRQAVELTDEEKEIINHKLIMAVSISHTMVTVTYFKADNRKSGGSYLTVTGEIKKFDETTGIITMTDKTEISLYNVVDISFSSLNENL